MMSRASHQFDPYQLKPTVRNLLALGLSFVFESVTSRSLSRLVRRKVAGQSIRVSGLGNLPETGVFVLAANHSRSGMTIGLAAAVMTAAGHARPDLDDAYMLVAGQRARREQVASVMARTARSIGERLRRLWARHLLVVLMENDRPDIKSLREWRRRCRLQPSVVFPEGKAGHEFCPVRQGCGKWLASLPVPTVPVGAWWFESAWHIRFGRPIEWSRRADLHDLQLGLTIASLLPADLTSDWQECLQRWQIAHSQLN